MTPAAVTATVLGYIAVLFAVAWASGRRADNAGFFTGNRRTPWYMAAFAMIGAAMSGVTFISVPGSVAADSFSYMQMVAGFTVGQLIVAFVLIPTFYRLRVVSLYEYLDNRFGVKSHRTGAWFFFVSKMLGAALRIYVVCAVIFWPSSFTLPNALRASNDVKFTMTVSIVSMWLCRIGFSYVFGRWLNMGLLGVWLAMFCDWIFRDICFLWRFFSGKWKNRQVI